MKRLPPSLALALALACQSAARADGLPGRPTGSWSSSAMSERAIDEHVEAYLGADVPGLTCAGPGRKPGILFRVGATIPPELATMLDALRAQAPVR